MSTSLCEHGAERNRHWPEGFAWMESTGTCGCCGTVFCCWYGHIPKDRCKQCGGREMTLEEAQEAVQAKYAPEQEPRPKTLSERLEEFKRRKRLSDQPTGE